MEPRFLPLSLTYVGTAILASFLLPSCSACENVELADTTCKPGAPATGQPLDHHYEVCIDGIDDDCDGLTDEECECDSAGELPDTRTCGGNLDGGSIGACAPVTVTCADGHFPACEPQREPGQYADNNCNGIDDDCDGETDEDYVAPECWTGPDYAVFGERSACVKGRVQCVNGQLTECLGEALPDIEACNNVDDDCNDQVDDGTVESEARCGVDTDVGACSYGSMVCSAGGVLACVGATDRTGESCNGLDDDCDGQTDEAGGSQPLVQRCETRCGSGFAECVAGEFVDCSARRPSEIDYCDGTDDDCDGQIDEDMPCPCRLGTYHECREAPLACGRGLQRCVTPDGCDPSVPYSCVPGWSQCEFFRVDVETCNGWDDDCDEMSDEGDDGNPLARACSQPDNSAMGECRLGSSQCINALWGECTGEIAPTDEVCDDKDNNCNGEIDDGLSKKVDMTFIVDISGSMCPYSTALKNAMNRYAANFESDEHRFSLVFFPGSMDRTQPYAVIANTVDFVSFQAALQQMNCNGGGEEPSYDVLLELTSPSTTPINWRSDATPYVILLADENAQTWNGTTQSMVAPQMVNCQVGNCQPGDHVEIYVITHKGYSIYPGWPGQNYSADYIEICLNDSSRIIEIEPPDEERYVQSLFQVFQDVCIKDADGGTAPVGGLDGGGPTSGGLDGGPPPGQG